MTPHQEFPAEGIFSNVSQNLCGPEGGLGIACLGSVADNGTEDGPPGAAQDEECRLTVDAGVVVSVAIQALVCVLGLVGNVFVILAIATTRKLQTTTSAYIGNLAGLDLLTCLLVMPAHMLGTLCNGWPLGHTSCVVLGHLMWYLTCLALFTLAVIATSRYLLVARSPTAFRRTCGRRNVAACLASLWLAGGLVYFVPVCVLMHRDLLDVSYSPQLRSCNLVVYPSLVGSTAAGSWTLSLPLVLFVLIGCVWIPLQFVLTFRALRRSKRRVHGTATLGLRRPQRLGLSREEQRLTRVLLLIYLVFLLLWLPLVLNVTLIVVFRVPSEDLQQHVFTVYLAGSALNPYIYGWLNRNFRTAFRRMLSKRCVSFAACRCQCQSKPFGVIL